MRLGLGQVVGNQQQLPVSLLATARSSRARCLLRGGGSYRLILLDIGRGRYHGRLRLLGVHGDKLLGQCAQGLHDVTQRPASRGELRQIMVDPLLQRFQLVQRRQQQILVVQPPGQRRGANQFVDLLLLQPCRLDDGLGALVVPSQHLPALQLLPAIQAHSGKIVAATGGKQRHPRMQHLGIAPH